MNVNSALVQELIGGFIKKTSFKYNTYLKNVFFYGIKTLSSYLAQALPSGLRRHLK